MLVPQESLKELKAIMCSGMACLQHELIFFFVSLVTCRHTPGPRVKLQPGSLAQGQDLADDKRGRPCFGKSHHLKKQENIKEY